MKENKTFVSFEDILSWQKSQSLAFNIYRLFGKNKDFSFRDQICRASVSISNNIAEGFDRRSDKQFIVFLKVANGSCAEVRSMLNLASRLDYITKTNFDILHNHTIEISKLISGLIRSLNKH